MEPKYRRILLKLSGESLMGHQGYGIDPERLGSYARQISELVEAGVDVAIVIGGGNIFRGLSGAAKGFDRVKGDQMGMLATVINSLALSSALESIGRAARVLTSIGMFPIGEPYSPMRALETLDNGTVAIIAGGTGNPFFTTDTKFDTISYDEIYNRGLKIMDLTATTLCRENGMKIVVFDMDTPGNLGKVLAGENIGTLVY